VNPGAHYIGCSDDDVLSLWDKPCYCIPTNRRPVSLPTCAADPKRTCALPRPVAAFDLVVENDVQATVDNIMRSIIEAGPVYTSFTTREGWQEHYQTNDLDLPWHKCGVGKERGGHAVLITGWGKETPPRVRRDMDYWVVRNSWGPKWGKGKNGDGYGKFKKGVNCDNIESMAVVAFMMRKDFDNFSPPTCHLTAWSNPYSYRRNFIGKHCMTQLELEASISCDSPAQVKLKWSNGANSKYYVSPFKATGRGEKLKITMDVKGRKDMMDAGVHHFVVVSEDEDGNTAQTRGSVTLPGLPMKDFCSGNSP